MCVRACALAFVMSYQRLSVCEQMNQDPWMDLVPSFSQEGASLISGDPSLAR